MINALFAGINFIIFVALMAYGIHKKILPQIRKALAREQSIYDNEQKNLTGLHHREQKLREEIASERQLAQELMQKITQWQQVLDKQHEQAQQLLALRQQQIIERRQRQEYEWFLKEQQKQLLPDVLKQAEDEMRLKMKDIVVREHYFAKVIHSLQRNVV